MNKFCKNCGGRSENGEKLCGRCESKVGSSVISLTVSEKMGSGDFFYSKDWQRKRVFVIASFPYFDVMFDKQYIYIIQMPKYSSAATFTVIGLFVFHLIGAAIGYYWGAGRDEEKREKYRSGWINNDNRLISSGYIKDIYIKIPLENLKKNIEIGRNKFTLIFGDKRIVLKKGQKEFIRFKEIINKYVL